MTRNELTRAITGKILADMNAKGWLLWRANSGKVGTKHGGWIHLAPAGTADIVGMTDTGQFIGIEVKIDRDDKLNDDQVKWHKMVKERDGRTYVAYPDKAINGWRAVEFDEVLEYDKRERDKKQ